jgi:hypothetical protein
MGCWCSCFEVEHQVLHVDPTHKSQQRVNLTDLAPFTNYYVTLEFPAGYSLPLKKRTSRCRSVAGGFPVFLADANFTGVDMQLDLLVLSAVLALSVVVLKGAVSAVHMSKRESVPTRFRRHWSSSDRTNVAHIAEPEELKLVSEGDAKAFADENLPAGTLALFDVWLCRIVVCLESFVHGVYHLYRWRCVHVLISFLI